VRRGDNGRTLFAVGAQGIHRRKRWRKLPEVEDIPADDVRRLFGRFRWGSYSPAGALERNGFFLRQLKRNGTEGVWPFLVQAKWVFAMFFAAVAIIALAVHLL
jgi:hypothetical protein